MLIAEQAKVLVVDDRSHPCGAPLPAEVDVVAVDCGSDAAAKSLAAFRPEVVLHLASKGGVQKAARAPGDHVRISVASTVALFDAAVRAGAHRIVTASSGGTVYGDPRRFPTSETTTPAPVSVYGAAKRSEEVYLSTFGRRHEITTLALRYGNVYGPRQDGTGEAGVVAITCQRMLEGAAPRVYGDGQQTRDFVYVADVASANVAAVFGHASGELNIGTGRETSINSVIKCLITESHMAMQSEFLPEREFEVRRVCLDTRRAHRYLNWKAQVSIESGLAQTWSWFCKRHLALRTQR
jgi:UDP-glucose 4-epimerase